MTELKEEKASFWHVARSLEHQVLAQELKPHSNIKNKSRICTLPHQSNLFSKKEFKVFIESRYKHMPVSSHADFAKVSIRIVF